MWAINSLEIKPGDILTAEIIACKDAINNYNSNITLRWIRGHNDSTGNEYADMLAKDGAMRGTSFSVPVSMCQSKMLLG
ncbi:Lian-Aa1 retrotransposon protein, partial [Caligus rogercresseyi]